VDEAGGQAQDCPVRRHELMAIRQPFEMAQLFDLRN